MRWKYEAFVFLFLSLFVTAVSASAQQQVPPGYQLLTDPEITGAHLVSTRPGTGSATSLLALALREVGVFFQSGLEVVGGFKDVEDRRAEVIFKAKLHGSPIGGSKICRQASTRED